MKGLRRAVVASDMRVCAHDVHSDGVREVGVENIWEFAVGEDFFDLRDSWKGRRHDEG